MHITQYAHPLAHASEPKGARRRCKSPGPMRREIARDNGMATLETALMVPILLMVTFIFIGILSIGMQTLSLSDATRTAARELARGAEPIHIVGSFKEREPHATINLQWDSDTVTVTTSKPAQVPVHLFGFPTFTIDQGHAAPREWNSGGGAS
jgi:hypothetical protein